MERHSLFRAARQEAQGCADGRPWQRDLQTPHEANQNPSKLLCGQQQTDSKVYTERRRTQTASTTSKGKGGPGGPTPPNFKTGHKAEDRQCDAQKEQTNGPAA